MKFYPISDKLEITDEDIDPEVKPNMVDYYDKKLKKDIINRLNSFMKSRKLKWIKF